MIGACGYAQVPVAAASIVTLGYNLCRISQERATCVPGRQTLRHLRTAFADFAPRSMWCGACGEMILIGFGSWNDREDDSACGGGES